MAYERSLAHSYLAQVPMFRSCTPEQLDHLVEQSTVVDVPHGKEVVIQGEPGGEFYVIMHGTAVVERDGHRVGELKAGDYFGELALFDPAPRNATVSAGDDLSLVSLTRSDFMRAIDEMPTIRDALLHGMAHRLHELDARA